MNDDIPRRASRKIAPLEGLRALAVGLVIASHSLPPPDVRRDLFRWWLPGPAGVRVFFVLSGFLITRILLGATEATDDRLGILRAFYARRVLRILPLAYVALAAGMFFDLPDVRRHWAWYATFSINLRTAEAGWDAGMGHFWSLAVEEQFYLLWPWVVLWTPRRLLPWTLWGMIALAVVSRLALLVAGQPIAAYVLMPARLDALAVGALLACWVGQGYRPPRWCWAAGVATVAIGAYLPRGAWSSSAMEAGMVMLSLMTVDRLRDLRRGILYRVAANPVATYLGGISYGIYVWHAMVAGIVHSIEHRTGWLLLLPHWRGWRLFVYVTALSLAVATVSWFLLERRFNNLKHRFPYVARHAELVARAG